MKRFNAWTIVLLIIAIYFITNAFLPNIDILFDYNLIALIFFALLAWQGRSLFLLFLGLAFASNFAHEVFALPYAKWPLFSGIVILGVVADSLFKPRMPGKTSHESHAHVDFDNDRDVYVKTMFSDRKYRVLSQNLDKVTVDAQFGSLKLDLRRAQFMTDLPEINLTANFSDVKIRLPKNCQVDTRAISAPLSDLKVEEADFDDDMDKIIKVTGSLACASLKFVY